MGGGDKPLLEIGGTTMLARIIDVLRPQTSAIAISANGDPGRFVSYGLPLLADGAFAGQGPLAGLLAGLDWARELGAGALLSVPGDTPFIPSDLAIALTPPPACAASRGQPHHLVALWPTDCRDELRRLLTVPGRRDIAHFARRIGMRLVDFSATEWDPFLNVNTPGDLAAARAIAEGERR